jgi:hypothetical protein
MLPSETHSTAGVTATKVAWIDRYRQRLTQALPSLAPIDAALLAVEAYGLQHGRRVCPDESADRFAATSVALYG